MAELNNTATAVGSYNSVPTSLTSNTSVVNMVEGLTLVKDADKKNWANGILTYTITINNQTDVTYVKPIVTDIIDTSLVEFIQDSVTINDVQATQSQYNYEEASHTLTVNLDDVAENTTVTLTFSVTKKS